MGVCANTLCGRQLGPWSCCPHCGHYTTVETGNIAAVTKDKIVTLDQVTAAPTPRVVIGSVLDSVWGGGFVPTATTLLAAPAGCGKTTMMLQVAATFAKITSKFAYYIGAEQAASELKLMVERIGIDNMDRIVVLKEFGSGAEIDEALFKEKPPCLFVVDSITDMCGENKKLELVIAKTYKKYSVKHSAPTVLICHMNKEGDTAGLYRMHHLVDTLIAIEHLSDDRQVNKFLEAGYTEEFLNDDLRILTAFKNRHGPTNKEHYLMMTPRGLQELPPPVKKERKKPKLTLMHGGRDAESGKIMHPLPGDHMGRPPNEGPVRVVAQAIEHNGQKLVNRKTAKPARAVAVEGEALKKKRPPMPRTKEAKKAAQKRMRSPKPKPKKGGRDAHRSDV